MTSRLVFTASAALALTVTSGQVKALDLSVLSNCEIQRTVSKVVHGPALGGIQCRQPEDELEATVLRNATPNACLTYRAPDGLEGFSCLVELNGDGGKNLSCFRSTKLSTIDEYKKSYLEKYSRPVSDYLEGARSCDTSNGDAAIAGTLQLGGPLLRVSRLEMGYVVAFDDNTGMIVHGFTSTDPDIDSWDEEALEIVYAFSAKQAFGDVTVATDKAEKWRIVTVDDGKEFKKAISAAQQAVQIPLAVEFAGFDLATGYKRTKAMLDEDRKSRGLRKLERAVEDILDAHSFTHLDDDELEAKIGKSSGDFADTISAAKPYGARIANDSDITIEAYFRESDFCSEDQGGSFALVMTETTGQNRPGEYGSVAALLLAGGRCLAQDRQEITQTAKELRNEIKAEVED
ncbi:hypothetical protein [Rhizobium ruizarguesonis]|uniref:hypothetical protein n=1 Tax=Rhizobium ruizarguesonis TaxID=2081791 RepID=UPI000949588B|nr:hypothetical protein [Rhizobium ruizarguesonis]UED34240.1 hypothetical protein BSO17_24340 [Rhizobium ruizarguesonis]